MESPSVTVQRFELRRHLGSGAMGAVYEAFDHKRGTIVAVKRLHAMSPDGLARLKREFRALADIAHRNLVTLHELVAVEDGAEPTWLLSMELVDGVPFLQWVRGAEAHEASLSGTSTEAAATLGSRSWDTDTAEAPAPVLVPPPEPVRGVLPPDLDRLRRAFRELAAGVAALHAHGRLHRDLKPSNVLVTADGRVVILDFGLVVDDTGDTGRHAIAGSVAYMAPEAIAGRPPSAANDWYAVGTMLYETLTGMRPYAGGMARILAEKTRTDPAPPAAVCDGVPPDLDALCAALLARDPADRPDAAAVLEALGAASEARREVVTLVGRDDRLAELAAAWASARSGHPILAVITGRSGVGKTALVDRFLADVRGGTVLRGRCYERESVPYKALDSLVDALAAWLGRPGRAIPPGADVVADVFPVLRRVPALAEARPAGSADPRERQGAMLRALAELLRATAPAIVAVDDAQWGDPESVTVFADLLSQPAPVMVLLTWRAEEDDAPFPAGLRRALRGTDTAITRIDLDVLTDADARALARVYVPDAPDDVVAAIARESGGSPMFVRELARHDRGAGAAPFDLDEALRQRVQTLPVRARELLEVVVIAGRPLPERVVTRALADPDRLVDLARLRSEHLVRTSGEVVEPYHDRVREAVAAALPAERRRALHRALADALEAEGNADVEAVATHRLGAEDFEGAIPFVLAAAERALAAVAFEHAARWFRVGADLSPPGVDKRRALVALGDALAWAGRGAEAVDVWQEASIGATPEEAVTLDRFAAQQAFLVGRIDRGLLLLRRAMGSLGLRLPRARVLVAASALWGRARLAWRGMAWQERTAISDRDRDRIDLCFGALNGLAYVDPLLTAELQARHLRLALDAGEPFRVARALVVEATQVALLGQIGRAEELLAQVRAIALRVRNAELDALEKYCAAFVRFSDERLADAYDLATEAEQRYLRRCSHERWQILRVRLLRCWTAVWTGNIRVLAAETDEMQREGERVGNDYVRTAAVIDGGWVVRLANDRPDDAVRAIEAAAAGVWKGGQAFQEVNVHTSRGHARLYAGDTAAALADIDRAMTICLWSLMRTVVLTRVGIAIYLGRALTARAEQSPSERSALLARARGLVAWFERHPTPASQVHGDLIAARVAEIEGDVDTAVRRYRAAHAGYVPLRYALINAAIERRIGALVGGDEGRDLVSSGERTMRDAGIARPEPFAAMLVGGWGERR